MLRVYVMFNVCIVMFCVYVDAPCVCMCVCVYMCIRYVYMCDVTCVCYAMLCVYCDAGYLSIQFYLSSMHIDTLSTL